MEMMLKEIMNRMPNLKSDISVGGNKGNDKEDDTSAAEEKAEKEGGSGARGETEKERAYKRGTKGRGGTCIRRCAAWCRL